MQITDHEILRRKSFLRFTSDDDVLLQGCQHFIAEEIDDILSEYQEAQCCFREMADLFEDAAVLRRLRTAQRRYVLDLFCGCTGVKYVTNRFRIGLVLKRIGVSPQLYLAALKTLKDIIGQVLERRIPDGAVLARTAHALDKLLFFDITLVFDTYLRSLLTEVELAKSSTESYALSLELQVADRTQQLEEKVLQLERALAAVKRLEGVIPICGVCKKIRNDEASWEQLEQYISEHSQALFSHGLCPDCYEKQVRAIDQIDHLQEEEEEMGP